MDCNLWNCNSNNPFYLYVDSLRLSAAVQKLNTGGYVFLDKRFLQGPFPRSVCLRGKIHEGFRYFGRKVLVQSSRWYIWSNGPLSRKGSLFGLMSCVASKSSGAINWPKSRQETLRHGPFFGKWREYTYSWESWNLAGQLQLGFQLIQ